MATGQIIRAWRDASRAYLAVRVSEQAGGDVEYIGSVPIEDLAGKTAAQQKAQLVAAVKAARDGQMSASQDIAISGAVTV